MLYVYTCNTHNVKLPSDSIIKISVLTYVNDIDSAIKYCCTKRQNYPLVIW